MSSIKSINPFTSDVIQSYDLMSQQEIDEALQESSSVYQEWRRSSFEDRKALMLNVAHILKNEKEKYAQLITAEMGKPISESEAEIEKSAWVCAYYAENAEAFLSPNQIKTEASKSYVTYEPIGVVLAVMPWNFPFWQVLRFAAPTIIAGNVALLKHASNVTGCALLIEKLFEEAGFLEGVFKTLVISSSQVKSVIESEHIKAVSLTGSEKAGASVASIAGANTKPSLLELGGNNACIILKDANLQKHIDTIVHARFLNSGQSCIAAKRFIVVNEIYDEFVTIFKERVQKIKVGDPFDAATELSVMAREDLALELDNQVKASLKAGASLLVGGRQLNAFYEPTILENVIPGMPVFDEETFGPVAAIIKVNTKEEAYELASQSQFGLGTMVFTEDVEDVLKHTHLIPDGALFVNELVKSDPRLPFGGTKKSGFGRELGQEGIMAFVNKKTVYIK